MTVLCGVLGFPVAHSRSPAMMNAAFAALSLDWRYVHLPVAPERFAALARALPGSGYRGANVTIPHKLAAHDLSDELTPAARAIGAVNTLAFEAGAILGDNTDAGGLIDAVGEAELQGRSALVLGAGGAGRAAAWALREAGAQVAVWNRTPARAVELARALGVRAIERGEPADILVNATSVGMRGEDAEAELPLAPAGLVVDLVYTAAATSLIGWGRSIGARVIDGREILVRQGGRSFERWTGRAAPLDAMRRGALTSSTDGQA